MLYDKYDENDAYKLARYLLNYDENAAPKIGKQTIDADHDPRLFTNPKVISEIDEVVRYLKKHEVPALTTFKKFRKSAHSLSSMEHDRSELLEENHVYDKYILATLKEFCIITIALLTNLERLHKKGIFCGNISPYNFMYIRTRKRCEPVDLSVILSDPSALHAEKQEHGDLKYALVDLGSIPENRYLAPELVDAVHMYNMQRYLKNLLYVAEVRGLTLSNVNEIKKLLLDFHPKKVKYSNKAEIYSVGYSINLILSHMLEKLNHFNLLLYEPIKVPVEKHYIEEADSLLPHEFHNPYQERIPELVNEAVRYIYDLMKEHVEQRDSLPESIAKFKTLLTRINMSTPGFLKEFEGAESELEHILGEEFEFDESEEAHEEHMHIGHDSHAEHVHATHVHDHVHDHDGTHGAHDHAGHDHAGHGHEDHSEHSHDEHHDEHSHSEHSEHQHDAHEHEAHGSHDDHGDHAGHEGHGQHSEHTHEHEAHEHEHQEHEHEAHEHEEHEHEAHEHEEHEHEAHEHEEHEHEVHEHEEHAAHEHQDHAAHAELVHQDHVAHAEHEHQDHKAANHDEELKQVPHNFDSRNAPPQEMEQPHRRPDDPEDRPNLHK